MFAESGYPAVGIDHIGAAVGITGPAIYRHFGSKAAVLAAVFDAIIDAVSAGPDPDAAADPDAQLRELIRRYAQGVSGQRALMSVFVREVHHLPEEHRAGLEARQRAMVGRWRTLLAEVHPDWDAEQVRTAVHGCFGMLNAVGTFVSPLPDDALADQLTSLAVGMLALPD